MKKLFFVLSIILMGTLFSYHAMAQGGTATNGLSLGMPPLNLLSSASADISLQLTTAVAGEAVQSSKSDSTARIKISSVITTGTTTKLSAKVTAGSVPAGTTLKLRAQDPNTNFGGTKGTLVGSDVTLSTGSDADIITAIGSCFSGTGTDDGYKLKYTWGLDNAAANYGLIRASGGFCGYSDPYFNCRTVINFRRDF